MLKTAFIIVSILFLFNLFWDVKTRLQNGATLAQLINSRFYEVFPLRAFFWTFFSFLGFKFLQSCLVTLGGLFGGESNLISSFSSTILLGGVLWILYHQVLIIANANHPKVNTRGVKISHGIHQYLFKNLGSEKFPNEISTNRHRENRLRKTIATVGICCLTICLFLFFYKQEFSIDFTVSLSEGFSLFQLLGLILILIVSAVILLLLFDNRDYTFVSFQKTIKIELCLCIAIILASLLIGYNFYTICFLGLFTIGCYGLRAIADLRLYSRYKRTKQTYNPITQKIEAHVNYLEQISKDNQLNLPLLKENAIAERISKGCKNLEEKGILVTRNFARFLNLVEVQYEEFAVAMLRYQTVRRYISLSGGTGTSRYFQDPAVPIWDLRMFPLKPPQGFVNWIDPLWLPSQWDVIRTCSTCGGTGRVEKTVTETDSDGRTRTRTEYETCSTCSGCGRLQYTQIINTQWQRLLPSTTSPQIPVPELVEDAEEKILYRLPIIENFQWANQPEEIINANSPLISKMKQSGQELKKYHQTHQKEVENLHDGSLYRADFAIASFRTILIKFINLGGSFGWFFGKRPEFYFPRLPLSYSAIFTLTLLPAMVILFTLLKQ